MTLLEKNYEKFVYVNKAKVPDGEGGTAISYTDGAEFQAAAVYDSSMQAKIAAAQGVTALYTITTTKDITLEYHELVKRVKDGKIFRITTDGTDNKTPDGAGLNMRQVSAEEYKI